jgi:hypothetical protein
MDQNRTAAGGLDTVMRRSGSAKKDSTCFKPTNVQYLLLKIVYPYYWSVIWRKNVNIKYCACVG